MVNSASSQVTVEAELGNIRYPPNLPSHRKLESMQVSPSLFHSFTERMAFETLFVQRNWFGAHFKLDSENKLDLISPILLVLFNEILCFLQVLFVS